MIEAYSVRQRPDQHSTAQHSTARLLVSKAWCCAVFAESVDFVAQLGTTAT